MTRSVRATARNIKQRAVFFLSFLIFTVNPLFSQACDSGTWTIAAQEPVTCLPYAANGIFVRQLPHAGSGGPVDHLAAAGIQTSLQNVLTDNNTASLVTTNHLGVNSPGTDSQGHPMYYGQAGDPLYKIAVSTSGEGTGTYFRAPNGAEASGSSDKFFRVWDQTSNTVVAFYNLDGLTAGCTASNEAQADADAECSMNFSGTGVQVSNYTTSEDWYRNNFAHAGNSLENRGNSTVIRHKEWMEGTIPHALYINAGGATAIYGDSDSVFPSPTDSGLTMPLPMGSLVFLDYTDAQIDAMGLPDWQEPLIRALAHYGAYVGDGTPSAGLNFVRVEGGEAFVHGGGSASSFYAWLDARVAHYSSGSLPHSVYNWNLELFTGISGVANHLFVADECVALGLAGMAGGCPDETQIPPACSFTQCETFNTYTSGADLENLAGGAGWIGPWVKESGTLTIAAAPAGGEGGLDAVSTNASSYFRTFTSVSAGTWRVLMRWSTPTPTLPNGPMHVIVGNYLTGAQIQVSIAADGDITAYNQDTMSEEIVLDYPSTDSAENVWNTVDIEIDDAVHDNQFRVRVNLGAWSGWKTAATAFTVMNVINIVDEATNTHTFSVDGIGGSPAIMTTAPLHIFSATRIR